MKINPLDHLTQAQTQVKAPADRKNGGPDFAQVLAEQQAAAAKPAGSAVAHLAENALTGLILASQGLDETAGTRTQRQLEKTLDQLDLYAAALGDPGRTLKELAPLADGLGQEAGRLSRLSQALGENNPLKGLSNEAAVLATVEAMKFRRGDYI